MTASNTTESAWKTYCNLPHMKSIECLGGEFSTTWMQDAEQEDLTHERLHYQFLVTRALVKGSHVSQWGERRVIPKQRVSDFLGGKRFANNTRYHSSGPAGTSWPKREAQLRWLRARRDSLLGAGVGNTSTRAALAHTNHRIHVLEKQRRLVRSTVVGIVNASLSDSGSRRWALERHHRTAGDWTSSLMDCHHRLVRAFSRRCFNLGQVLIHSLR